MTPDLLPANFAAKIRVDEAGCWIFTGCLNSQGYGCIAVNGDGTINLTHRVAYALLVDRIPVGFVIDHLCRVRACCNPAHLEAVTVGENNRRALAVTGTWREKRTHCKHGHEYTTENTYLDRGHRGCRECKAMLNRLAYQNRRRTLARTAQASA